MASSILSGETPTTLMIKKNHYLQYKQSFCPEADFIAALYKTYMS
jgi:hypothetical protein